MRAMRPHHLPGSAAARRGGWAAAFAVATAALIGACADPVRPDAPATTVPAPPPPRPDGLVPDSAYLTAGDSVEIDVLANDRWSGAGTPSVELVVAPFAGSARVAGGRIVYRSNGELGRDVMAYRLVRGAERSPATLVHAAVVPGPVRAGRLEVVRQAVVTTPPLRLRHEGEDLDGPTVRALRPMVARILAAYGNPTSQLDRARALRDWLARTAVHPVPVFHPDGSSSNASVLPPGTTWRDANVLWRTAWDRPNLHQWAEFGYDGYASLDHLLGTLDPATGRRSDDGLMQHLEGVHYRIRDLRTYPWVLCSYQDVMLLALWAAGGMHGMLISTWAHDPAAVFVPELGKWVYEDPTYNEEFALDGAGQPLSPVELLVYSLAWDVPRLQPRKLATHPWTPYTYPDLSASPRASFILDGNYLGLKVMGSQLYNRTNGRGVDYSLRHVQVPTAEMLATPPFNNPWSYARVAPAVAFPDLGVGIADIRGSDARWTVHLTTSYPNHVKFQRRVGRDPWQDCDDVDALPAGALRVEYRSVDAAGTSGMTAVLQVRSPAAASS